jgi:hypothetical protein
MKLRFITIPLCLLVCLSAAAQEPAYKVQDHYTKFDYQVPMRDGVKLFTSVYAPKDSSQKYPFMMQRTPYSVAPYGDDAYRSQLGPSPLLAKEGFIFVYQDVRGISKRRRCASIARRSRRRT